MLAEVNMPLFDGNKSRGSHANQDSMWTSYSDLFLGLSVVFLLLYVTASLRQGTEGIQQHVNYQKLSKENADLQQQLQVYSTLKQDYLDKQANQDERQNYEELMGKLDLLQDQAKDEKNRLQNQAKENEKKAAALNKYQQMIRNIINTNMLAKSRIKNRDTMIADQGEEITDLQTAVTQKKAQIAAEQNKIANLEENLQSNLQKLKNAWKAHSLTKKKYEDQQRSLTAKAESQISALKAQEEKTARDLAKLNSELKQTETALTQASSKNTELTAANSQLSADLSAKTQAYQAQVSKLKGDFAAQQAKDQAEFAASLNREKLSGQARAAKEAAFREAAEGKAKALAGQLSDLDGKFKATSSELAKAQENLNARKKIAGQIASNFAKNGIKADVDQKTGDVILAFGGEYFDSDSANLKHGMRKILEQAVPVYSASLFDDQKVAEKISNVEIVGFASPTYKGKYVDPRSLNPSDRQAVNYNLDLSYNRAKSIFNHIFDQNKMSFKYQQKLLPLVKVTGKSFLDQADRGVASESPDSFCRKNDCSKMQRVIIKFNLKD